jgi:hypothetical protein
MITVFGQSEGGTGGAAIAVDDILITAKSSRKAGAHPRDERLQIPILGFIELLLWFY